MPHDPEKYLHDMLDSVQFLMSYTLGRTFAEFEQDRGFRSAVQYELQIIGEALLQLERVAPRKAENISEHRRIIGFRHILVHGYDALKHDLVWFVVQEKLPVLRGEIESILGQSTG